MSLIFIIISFFLSKYICVSKLGICHLCIILFIQFQYDLQQHKNIMNFFFFINFPSYLPKNKIALFSSNTFRISFALCRQRQPTSLFNIFQYQQKIAVSSSFFFKFFCYSQQYLLNQMDSRQTKLFLTVVIIVFGLFQYSQSTEDVYQVINLSFPFQLNSAFFNTAQLAKMEVLVKGANAYHHIAFAGMPSGKSKLDTTLHRADVYDAGSVSGSVRQYVQIIDAPGLVKIQMVIYQANVKKSVLFYIGAQFNRGYSFVQLHTTVGCRMKISMGGPNPNGNYNLFSSKADAFSTSLPQFTFGSSIITITKPGKNYIRISYNTSLDIPQNQIAGVTVLSLSDSPCQNQCPYGSDFAAVFQTTMDFCMCATAGSFFNQATRTCTACTISSTQTQCTQIARQICGNGFKQGTQTCDNENMPGCTNCTTIDTGYTCTENQYGQSICGQTPPQTITKTEEGLSIQARNRIIIGVCVGVGGGIIVGLAIFFIVKHLKAKAALSQTSNLSQDKTFDSKKQESGSIML